MQRTPTAHRQAAAFVASPHSVSINQRLLQGPTCMAYSQRLDARNAPPPQRSRAMVAASAVQQQQQQQQQQQRGSRSVSKAPLSLAEPAPHQQTLRRSFMVGGIGLHTGEYTIVRVRPAFADEGRYFVHVPRGTNQHLWEVEQPAARALEEVGASSSSQGADEVANAKLFFEFAKSQETGNFNGTFADYFQQRTTVQPDTLLIDAEAELLSEEEPVAGQPGEARLPAHVSSLRQGPRWCSILAHGSNEVWGAEHLLAALECCGVDNARIEVEGGREMPVIDGSALGWAVEVQSAGLRVAPAPTGAGVPALRRVAAPQEAVVVRDGEAFITFYPGPRARVTVGIDCGTEAPVIGRQWFTWSPEDSSCQPEDHFRFALAPARTVFASENAVRRVLEEGMLQGGPEYVSLIADQDDWLDPTLVRFPSDEAARHGVVDLLGDLSLLAHPGGRGLPTGHVVAYQPTHALQAAFLLQMEQVVGGLL